MNENKSLPLLKLPQLDALQENVSSTSLIIVSGGRAPSRDWLEEVAAERTLWAADSGVRACLTAGLTPDFFLGDGDSAGEELLSRVREKNIPAALFPADKDFTDTQLAIKKAEEAGAGSVLLTGVFGGRFDHAYNTLFSAAFASVRCTLADEKEALFYLHGGESLAISCKKAPVSVSLIPFTRTCAGVTAKGLKWELSDALLLQGQPSATSNRLDDGSDSFLVSLGRGTLGVYLCFSEH